MIPVLTRSASAPFITVKPSFEDFASFSTSSRDLSNLFASFSASDKRCLFAARLPESVSICLANSLASLLSLPCSRTIAAYLFFKSFKSFCCASIVLLSLAVEVFACSSSFATTVNSLLYLSSDFCVLAIAASWFAIAIRISLAAALFLPCSFSTCSSCCFWIASFLFSASSTDSSCLILACKPSVLLFHLSMLALAALNSALASLICRCASCSPRLNCATSIPSLVVVSLLLLFAIT